VLLDLEEYDSLEVHLESRNTRNTGRRWCVNVFKKTSIISVHWQTLLSLATEVWKRE